MEFGKNQQIIKKLNHFIFDFRKYIRKKINIFSKEEKINNLGMV